LAFPTEPFRIAKIKKSFAKNSPRIEPAVFVQAVAFGFDFSMPKKKDAVESNVT
jgi:hypothetical protein